MDTNKVFFVVVYLLANYRRRLAFPLVGQETGFNRARGVDRTLRTDVPWWP